MNFSGKTLLFAFVVLLFGITGLHAQGHEHNGQNSQVSASPAFAENMGQWPSQVHFAAEVQAGMMFLEKTGFSYNFYDSDNLHDRYFHRNRSIPSDEVVNFHAFKVHFLNANLSPAIYANHKREEIRSYYLGSDPDKWAGGVGVFDLVRYENLWQGVDLLLYGKDAGLKYDLILEPGADYRQIQMKYEGLDKLYLDEGKLVAKTSVNEVIELAPYAYQMVNGEQVEVACEFVLRKKTLSFRIKGKYDPDLSLVIDPTLIFATYTGSLVDNWGFTATYDESGNLYAAGNVFGVGYPTTTGAYDVSFNQGNTDIAITKFNSTGTSRIYSTYIGGSNAEQPHSLVVNEDDELYMLGTSQSTDFPSVNGYDNTHNGGYDIVVCRFNALGSQLMNSTFMGGASTDGINIVIAGNTISLVRNYGDSQRGEIIVDRDGEVYVASCSQSTGFPVSQNAFQSTLAGAQDGVLFKLDATLDTLRWSTYVGGTADDACYGLKVDAYKNVFSTGGTASSNFPTTSNSYQPNHNGGIDGFIVKMLNDGTSLIGGTYLGTSSTDQSYFIEIDKDYDVYVVGQTQGNYPVTAGVYTNPGSAQFISKLTNSLGSIVYSTRFGSTNGQINISPTAFLVDVCEYVYVSGWGGNPNFTGSTNGMPVTANAFKSTTDGEDLYFVVFEKDLVSLDFASYYGGNGSREHVDGGTSRFDRKAVIYQAVCAGCGGNSLFQTTPGVVGPTNLSSNCNLGAMKIEFPLPGILADFSISPSAVGCAPHQVSFNNQSVAGANTNYTWVFGDGTPSSGQNSPTHIYQNGGSFEVLLIAYDPTSCNVWDTTTKTITVLPAPVVTLAADSVACTNDPVQIFASGGVSYLWDSDPSFISSTSSQNPIVNPVAGTTYFVTVTAANGCTSRDSITIQTFPAPPVANASPADTTICQGDSCQLGGSGAGVYAWTNGATLTDDSIANPIAFPTVSTQYILSVTDANNCVDRDTVQVNVSQVQANAGPDQAICIGDTANINGGGGASYNWSPNNGISNSTNPNIQAWPATSQVYTLLVTDVFGCTSLDSMQLTVNPLPIVTANPDTSICLNQSITLLGSGAQTYIWTPDSSLNNGSNQNPVATPTQTTTYTLVATDQNNCRNSAQVTVNVLPLPVANAGQDQVICEDSTVQLLATGGVSYAWTPPASLNNPAIFNPLASPSVSTNFIVTVTAVNGCTEVDTVYIMVTPTPVVNVSGDREICAGTAIRLVATGPADLWWSTGENTNIIYVQPDTTTTYSVSGAANGCLTKANTITVTVHDTFPTASFLADPDTGWLPLEVNFANLSIGHVSSHWLFGDGNYSNQENPNHIYQDTGLYISKLVVTNSFGCTDTAYKVIFVKGDFTIFVPNAFTPNGDHTNDFFSIESIGIKTFTVLIFDRWGQLIYESDDKEFNWDGEFKNHPCQEEVYTWMIKATSHLGHKVRQAGTVTLLR